jgi:hypothetical protein
MVRQIRLFAEKGRKSRTGTKKLLESAGYEEPVDGIEPITNSKWLVRVDGMRKADHDCGAKGATATGGNTSYKSTPQ